MNRRSFLRTASAAAVTPLLPVPSFAAAQAATVNEFQLGWATMFSRVHAKATPDLIQRWLRVSPAQAETVMGELVKRGVVRAPVAGSAAAVKPMYGTSKVPGFVTKGGRINRKLADILDDHDTETKPVDATDDLSDIEEVGIDTPPEMQKVGTDSGARSHGFDCENISGDES